MSWLQIKLDVPGAVADELSDECLELGALSVVLDNAGPDSLAESVLEPAPGATIVWERVVITAMWDTGQPLDEIARELQTKVHDKGIFAEVDVIFVGADALAAIPAQPVAELSFGAGRLWLVPRDVSTRRRGELATIPHLKLDPGLAFGSGLHPTTQLCLDALALMSLEADNEEAELVGSRLLDFGCGSGVLALAALTLGAAEAHAVDHDPQALVATRDNAAYNDLTAGIQVFMPDDLPGGRYAVVVANILANPLIELAPEISKRLQPGGTLIMAGLLAQQAKAVLNAYPEIEFEPPVCFADVPGAPSGMALDDAALAALAADDNLRGESLSLADDTSWVRLQGRLPKG